MCLLFIYLASTDDSGRYKLILANNRDEYFVRPTADAAFRGDHPQWIGGMDMEEGRVGGTWLGLTKSGKMACLLNILAAQNLEAKGRGSLVRNFLTGDMSCEDYLSEIQEEATSYNPFHLILMDFRENKYSLNGLWRGPNQQPDVRHYDAGIYGFDNGQHPDRPWRKNVAGQKTFSDIVEKCGTLDKREDLISNIIDMLNDKTPYVPDEAMEEQMDASGRNFGPKSGDGVAQLSAVYVDCPSVMYGTRTNIIILVDQDNNCEYIERTMKTPTNLEDRGWTVCEHKFKLEINS